MALFCKQGYSGTDLSDHNSRAFRRIQSVYRSVLLALDNTVFSDNLPDVLRSSIVDVYSKRKSTSGASDLKELKGMEQSVLDLSITGHRHVSSVASAILAGSFTRELVKAKTKSQVEQLLIKI